MRGTRQGDFSRYPLDRRKGYSAVRLQQGRAHLDADWNEQADLLDHRVRTATADVLGPDGAPAAAAGFALSPDRLCLELGIDHQHLRIGGREGCVFPPAADGSLAFTAEVRLLARTEGQVFGCWVAREGDTQPRPACALHLRDRTAVFQRSGVSGDLASARRWDLSGRLLHLAVVWSPAGATIYLDGAAVASDRRGFLVSPGRLFYQVGGGRPPYLEGLFYDFRLWNEERSPEELARRLDRDLGGDEPGLVGYWRFDEADGSSIPDRSAAAHRGGRHGYPAEIRGSVLPPRWLPAELRVGAGRYYVDGVLCESSENVPYTAQPEAPGATLPQPAGREPEHWIFYLDVWESSVSAIEDPDIREVALGGADTTTRDRVMARVRCLRLDSGEERLDARDVRAAWPRLIAPELAQGRLMAQRRQLATPRVENLLYRVEVHDDGDGGEAGVASVTREGDAAVLTLAEWDGRWRAGQAVELYRAAAGPKEQRLALARVVRADAQAWTLALGAAKLPDLPADGLRARRIATFKWSRYNASAVYPVARLDPEARIVTLQPTPTGTQGLEAGSWVELVDAAAAPGPGAEPLRQVANVDATAGKVTLQGAPLTGRKLGKTAFLRLWDQRGSGLTPWGAVPAARGDWLDVEAGIQVRFEYDHPYRGGDYWWMPARSLTQEIDWPRDAKGQPRRLLPHGVEHRFCVLALLSYEPERFRLLDLRRTFQPYTTGPVSKGGDWMEGPLDVRADAAVRGDLEVDGAGRFGAVYGPLRSPDSVHARQLADGCVTPEKLSPEVGLVPDGWSILGPAARSPAGYTTTGWSFTLFDERARWSDRRLIPGGPPGPLQSAAAGGKVYTLLENGTLWELDPAPNVWRPRRTLPSPGRGFAMASLAGRVYVAGGLDAAGRSLAQLWEYDPATDVWTQRASLRTPRSSFALVGCQGWLHALGGLRDSPEGKCVTGRHEAWDPVTDTWHSRRRLPERLAAAGGASLGDRISIVGGETRSFQGRWGRSLTGEHHQYHPASDLWSAGRAPLPTPRRAPRLVAVHGRLFAVGGEAALGWLAEFDGWDPATGLWTSWAPLHEAVEAPGAAAVDGTVYVIGAVRPGGVLVEACPVSLKLFVHQRRPGAGDEGEADGGEPPLLLS